MGFLFTSSDNGNTWQAIDGLNPGGIYDIVENQLGYIFVATGEGVYRSTDDGNSWYLFSSGLSHIPTWKLAVDSLGYLYASTGLPQMLYGTVATTIPVELVSFTAIQNEDKVNLTWETTTTELNNLGFEIERKIEKGEWRTIGFKEGNGTTTEIQRYNFTDDFFAGSNSKFYYRLKQIDFSGSFDYSEEIEVLILLTEFSVAQNYPNPFNPTTTIKYQTPERSFVTIKVYDVLGNKVVTLVNDEKPEGSYEIEFDGSRLTSGIYFYRLKAGDYLETKKMILLK